MKSRMNDYPVNYDDNPFALAAKRSHEEQAKRKPSILRTVGATALVCLIGAGSLHQYVEKTAGPDEVAYPAPIELTVETSPDPFCSFDTFTISDEGLEKSIADKYGEENVEFVEQKMFNQTAAVAGRDEALPDDTVRVYPEQYCIPKH